MADTARTAESRLTAPQSSAKASDLEDDGEDEGGRRGDLAGDERPVPGPVHDPVDVPVDDHVDGVGPTGGQRPADQGGERSAGATGTPPLATNIVGTVVTSSSSMMRGLVSAT